MILGHYDFSASWTKHLYRKEPKSCKWPNYERFNENNTFVALDDVDHPYPYQYIGLLYLGDRSHLEHKNGDLA